MFIDYFYSYIDLSCNNAIPSENDEFSIIEIGYLYAKMISIEKDIGKIITKQIDELIDIIKNTDNQHNRMLVKKQLETIINIAKGNSFIDDLLPINLVDVALKNNK